MSHAPDRAAVSRELLSDWVGRWAKDRPDVQALSYREERWTWTQWHDRVRRATGLLSAAGVRRGDRIAFLDKNNPVCLELTFAAAALGATIAIANWRLAGDELAYVLRDSGATILFAGSGFVTSIDAIDTRALQRRADLGDVRAVVQELRQEEGLDLPAALRKGGARDWQVDLLALLLEPALHP